MKSTIAMCLLFLLSCRESERPRFVVKKVAVSKHEFIEWYNYSNFSNHGVDRVDYVDSLGNRTLIFKSHYVSDISYDSGTIEISWWYRGEINAMEEINGYALKIDSGGCSLMSSDARRTHGETWSEDICLKYSKVIEFERQHPNQYDDPKKE